MGASLVYIVSSKIARATEENNVKRDREKRGGRWHSPLIPAFERRRKEDQKFKVSLIYVSSRPAWTT